MQTQPNMEPGYYPSYDPKKGYKRRMASAGFMALVLTCLTLYGIDAALDGTVPQVIVWIYNQINSVCTFLFVTNGTFNNKTLFIVLMFLVFAGIGMYRVLVGWALWLCSRDKERGQLFSWFPNLLHHEYAVDQIKQVGKDEVIKKMQQRITELEALNAAHEIVFNELTVTVKDTSRERRLVMNLDHLIGKCYNLAAKSFTKRDKEPYRLNLFLSSICAEICSTTIDSTNNKHSYIFLRNFPEESMVLVGECRSGSSTDGSLKFSKGEGFVGQVWEENRRILYTDISSQAADIIVKQGERRYNSIVGLPIIHHQELIGVIVVASQSKDEVSEADFDNIERYLNIIQLSLLIELSYQIRLGGDEHAILLELLSQKVSF